MSDDRTRAKVMGLLQRLQTVYGPPPGHDEETLGQFYDEYIRVLSTFDSKLLGKAGDRLLRTCKFWPRPSEIVDVVDHLVPAASGDDTQAHKLIRERDEATRAFARLYLRECPSSLVDMAMRQGWGRSLEDWARQISRQIFDRDGKLPTMRMMADCRMSASNVEWYAKYGQPHLPNEASEIMSARHQTGATRMPETSRRMTGEHVE